MWCGLETEWCSWTSCRKIWRNPAVGYRAGEIQVFRRAAFDVEIEKLEEKLWLRPDADPSDFFNYGMGEDTWRDYCNQQLVVPTPASRLDHQ